jgi:hypothetical protein
MPAVSSDDRSEFVVLYVSASVALRPIPIYAAEESAPIDPDWIAITESSELGSEPDCWLLYFLRDSGDVLEMLQWETLDIALDQASSIAGILHSSWKRCRVEVPESGLIARELVRGLK